MINLFDDFDLDIQKVTKNGGLIFGPDSCPPTYNSNTVLDCTDPTLKEASCFITDCYCLSYYCYNTTMCDDRSLQGVCIQK